MLGDKLMTSLKLKKTLQSFRSQKYFRIISYFLHTKAAFFNDFASRNSKTSRRTSSDNILIGVSIFKIEFLKKAGAEFCQNF